MYAGSDVHVPVTRAEWGGELSAASPISVTPSAHGMAARTFRLSDDDRHAILHADELRSLDNNPVAVCEHVGDDAGSPALAHH